MKITSPLFDSIRVKPSSDRRVSKDAPVCDWQGCDHAATNRAPKGRGRDNEYWHFCIDHVRAYNASYNFFAGMTDADVTKYQKDAITGHRPTWKMGTGKQEGIDPAKAGDPFGMFREVGGGNGRARAKPKPEPEPERRTVRNAERKALDVMGLDIEATAVEVKARYKVLVKRHHPDANGGDRAYEEKLREIITAYNYLKSVGYG